MAYEVTRPTLADVGKAPRPPRRGITRSVYVLLERNSGVMNIREIALGLRNNRDLLPPRYRKQTIGYDQINHLVGLMWRTGYLEPVTEGGRGKALTRRWKIASYAHWMARAAWRDERRRRNLAHWKKMNGQPVDEEPRPNKPASDAVAEAFKKNQDLLAKAELARAMLEDDVGTWRTAFWMSLVMNGMLLVGGIIAIAT